MSGRGGANKGDRRVMKAALIDSADLDIAEDSNSKSATKVCCKKTVSLVLHDITEELEREGKKAESKYKNMLLFSLSHELKTPLNIFQGFLAESKRFSQSGEHLKALFLEAKGAWRYLRNKINDILDYAQILSDEFALHYTIFSTKRFVRYLRKTTSFLLTGAKSKTVSLDFSAESTVPDPCYADRDRIEQVLFNFLSNAAKFTDRGCIALHISRSEEGIGRNYIKFEVKDTGIGMTRETVDGLFTLCRGIGGESSASLGQFNAGGNGNGSARSTGRKATRLSGLGLTVSKMVCERMGTDICVISELGKGSAFSFQIPVLDPPEHSCASGLQYKHHNTGETKVADTKTHHENLESEVSVSIPDEDAGVRNDLLLREFVTSVPLTEVCHTNNNRVMTIALPRPPTTEQRCRGKVALVVDDNDFNRYVAERMLKKFGFKTVPAENGKVAIDTLRKINAENIPQTATVAGCGATATATAGAVVFMDVDMPVMDGIEATIQIRREKMRPRPIIVALTAFSAESERVKCFEAGMDFFLDKPLTKERLCEVLCNAGL